MEKKSGLPRIEYLGQCGFAVYGEKLSFAIDPVLTDLLDGGESIRLYPPVMGPENLCVDYIFVTHEHIDHMALETLSGIAAAHEKTKFVLPKGCVSFLTDCGIDKERIIALSDSEDFQVGSGVGANRGDCEGLKVRAYSAAHPIHAKNDKGEDCNLIYAITLEGLTYVHLGDTYRTERLFASLQSIGEISYFFPPINGRDEERDKKGIIGNLSYAEAAKLAVDLSVKCSIPTHFDMVRGNTEDPEKFVHALRDYGYKGESWIPKLGESCIW